MLTVIDKWHRQCVALEADFALSGQSVVDAMNEIAQGRQLPYAITVDHRTEFTSKVRDEWCYLRGVDSISSDLENRPRTASSSRSTGAFEMSV